MIYYFDSVYWKILIRSESRSNPSSFLLEKGNVGTKMVIAAKKEKAIN